jgi:hypothetical protein
MLYTLPAMSRSEASSRLVSSILSLYMLSVGLAVAYYNWESRTESSRTWGIGSRINFSKPGRCSFTAYETTSNEELRRGNLLNDQWADWYASHRQAIEDASNVAIGAQ